MYKIFLVNIDEEVDEGMYQFLFNYIQDSTKKRIMSISSKRKAIAVLVGEILAKVSIMNEFNIDYRDIYFTYNEYGKPFIKGHENIHFNLSNSENWVACVIANCKIGIDIEKIKKYNEGLAKRICTEEENKIIKKSENPSSEFIKYWTKKEAVLKMIGKGFAYEDVRNCLKNVKTKSFLVDKKYWVSFAYNSDEIVNH